MSFSKKQQIFLAKQKRTLEALLAERPKSMEGLRIRDAPDKEGSAAADLALKETDALILGQLNPAAKRRKVEDALSRVEQGIYFDCSACPSKILMNRLRAVPWTDLCIQCVETEERRKRELQGNSSLLSQRKFLPAH